MKQYPLIDVSIIVVVLLILTSMVNVIGFQTIQSSTTSESPLFAVQTTQAIDGSRLPIKTEYLGKGTPSSFRFPNINTRGVLLDKALAILTKMTPQQIKRLHRHLASSIYQNAGSSQAAASALASFNNEQQGLQDLLGVNRMNGNGSRNDPPTFYCPTLFGYWVPSCTVEGVLLALVFILAASFYVFCTFFLCFWIYRTVLLCQTITENNELQYLIARG
jgi:hypothetical protein